MYCEHGRLADACEDCTLIAAMERGYRPHTLPTTPRIEPELADGDTYLDHGHNKYTVVKAGNPIPPGLTHLPRSKKPEPATKR